MFIFLDLDGVLVPEKKFETPVSPEAFMAFDPDCLREFGNRTPIVSTDSSSHYVFLAGSLSL